MDKYVWIEVPIDEWLKGDTSEECYVCRIKGEIVPRKLFFDGNYFKDYAESVTHVLIRKPLLDIISEQIFDLFAKYRREYKKIHQMTGVMWIENTQTKEFILFTDMENYSEQIKKTVNNLIL